MRKQGVIGKLYLLHTFHAGIVGPLVCFRVFAPLFTSNMLEQHPEAARGTAMGLHARGAWTYKLLLMRMCTHMCVTLSCLYFSCGTWQAEHKKVYIPQRLEEIEQEEAKLQDRMSAFNSKIKDKEIKEL